MDITNFGEYLMYLRGRISQRDLAKLAGISNATISRIENGLVSPDIATLGKIATALDISRKTLLCHWLGGK